MENNKKILIADDEPEVLSLYKIKLRQAGYNVITATDGAQAIEIAEKELPDLVLMDMKMPHTDGITALRTLQANPATKNLRVVFITAFSDPQISDIDHDFSNENGALGFIKKGISLDEFVAEVQSYL